ncbi:MAG: tetratricopeptide repeat protein, partial [Phycisphaerae bacterium]|nr:tetratricopeptide repeat protein [Phycisphaerae bacterium]
MGITVVLAVALGFSAAAFGESVSVLLEKGVFKEETAGDLDAAIKIYKQIVEDAKANRKYVAEAHYRLGMCHLKKGDKAKAAGQFRQLVRSCPDQRVLVTKAKAQLAKLAPPALAQALRFGPVVERTVYHTKTGKDFLIDFDTGNILTPPPADTFANNRDAGLAWVRDNGIDAAAKAGQDIRGFGCYDMAVVPTDKARWNSITAERLQKELAEKELRLPNAMLVKGKLPATFLFKTREGNMGILQILQVNWQKLPQNLKIRYKILVRGPVFLPLNKVVERTVYDDSSGRECLIDIDTGKVFGPRALKGMAKGKVFAQCAKMGIDAGAETSRSGPGLWGIDMIVIPRATEPLEKIILLGITDELATGKPGTPAVMSALGELPRTYAFKTREGSMGVLQILKVVSKKPSHIKIRYKLLKHGTAAEPQVRKAHIPDADTKGVRIVLDLASGEMLPNFPKGSGIEYYAKLGKGDLAFDGNNLICIRGAMASLLKSGRVVPLTPKGIGGTLQYEIGKPPIAFLVKTAEGRNYEVTVLSIKGGGINIEYKLLKGLERRLAPGDVVQISVLDLLQDGREAIFPRQVTGSGVISL